MTTDKLQAFPKKTKLKMADIVSSPNVAAKLSEAELLFYGEQIVTGYDIDKMTRREWEERNAKATELALQLIQKKSFPWVGASNVKFPLVTVAVLQFLARISIITSGRQLVKAEPWGSDPKGEKGQKAARISTHMSYQLLEQNRHWVDDDEMAKLSAGLLGCAIKKTFHDGVEGVNRSEYVPIDDFVVDYYTKNLQSCQRATHRLRMFPNQIEENVRRGLFCKMEEADVPAAPRELGMSPLANTQEEISGLRLQVQDNLRPIEVLEQHLWLDLDNDGYNEPYVASVRYDTKQVLRIVARYFDEGDVYRANDAKIRQLDAMAEKETDPVTKSTYEKEAQRLEDAADNKIIRITPIEHFTKYTFIPAPDGGFYGLGLGALLGPTNAAVDTIINQIIDAGTMLTTSGGFLGRGVKIKSGKQTFDPFEWKPVDGSGDDLRKNIVPLPVNAPPEVLFQLLGLLIGYGEKVGSSTDAMTGVSPGQNTPAETSRNTMEQGMMLFSGIYKRMYRAFGEELRKVYQLNRWYLRQCPDFVELTSGEGALILETDYDSNTMRIYPAADATAVSPQQKQQKAKIVFDAMNARPNGFNQYEVTKRLLEAYDVDGIDTIFPDPKGPNAIEPLPIPKVELEKAKLQQAAQKHQDEMQLGIAELKVQMALNDAKITELTAKAQKELAEAQGVGTGHAIALVEAQLGAAKAHREGLLKVLDTMQRAHTAEQTALAKSSQ